MSKLEKFKRLHNEATPEPWTCWSSEEDEMGLYRIAEHVTDDIPFEVNAQFITETRNLAPKLIKLWEVAQLMNSKITIQKVFSINGLDNCFEVDEKYLVPFEKALKELEQTGKSRRPEGGGNGE